MNVACLATPDWCSFMSLTPWGHRCDLSSDATLQQISFQFAGLKVWSNKRILKICVMDFPIQLSHSHCGNESLQLHFCVTTNRTLYSIQSPWTTWKWKVRFFQIFKFLVWTTHKISNEIVWSRWCVTTQWEAERWMQNSNRSTWKWKTAWVI